MSPLTARLRGDPSMTIDPQVLDGTILIRQPKPGDTYTVRTFAQQDAANQRRGDRAEMLMGVVFILTFIFIGYLAMYGIATIGMS